VNISLWA
ncbi:phosphofructokinase family protein, partial [Chlamydia psittaci 06-1683]